MPVFYPRISFGHPALTYSTWIARYLFEGVLRFRRVFDASLFLAATLPDKDPGSKSDNMDDLPALNLVGMAPICSLVFFLVPR